MIVHRCEQYSPEWWELRRGKVSASCAKKIITPVDGLYSEQGDAYINQLIADLYDPRYGWHESYESAEMRNGRIMEPEARDFYELDRDCEIEQVGMCVSDCGRFSCSPDLLVPDKRRGAEIKCPSPATQVKWLRSGKLPNEHKPQMHHSLIVTGYDAWDFLSYAPGLPKLLIEVRPDAYTEKLRTYLERFWIEYGIALDAVKLKFPPPPAPIIVEFGALGTVEYMPGTVEQQF